jgi:hypothetical protein
MYNEYIVNMFKCVKLSLHDSKCLIPAVYLTALFWRIKFLLISAFALCPRTVILCDRRGSIKLQYNILLPCKLSMFDSLLIMNKLQLILLHQYALPSSKCYQLLPPRKFVLFKFTIFQFLIRIFRLLSCWHYFVWKREYSVFLMGL